MKYKVRNEIFDSSSEAYDYCEEENISLEEVEEVEEGNLENLAEGEKESIIVDSAEEPLEESGMTEEEVRGAIVLENYQNIEDENLKKQVLSRALGQSVGSDKKFSEPIKLSEVDRAYLERLHEKLSRGVCPECDKHYTQLGQDLSLEAEEDLKEGLILSHIEKEHPKIYEMLKDLFPVPQKTETGVQHVMISNPESCSREELAKTISSDPQLSREFYLKAFKKLQGKD